MHFDEATFQATTRHLVSNVIMTLRRTLLWIQNVWCLLPGRHRAKFVLLLAFGCWSVFFLVAHPTAVWVKPWSTDNAMPKFDVPPKFTPNMTEAEFVAAFKKICEEFIPPNKLEMPRQRAFCPCVPLGIAGAVQPDMSPTDLQTVELLMSVDGMRPGGHWTPSYCHPRQRLAVILPFKERHAHLPILLRHLIPFLQKQQLEFRFFVVEQTEPVVFNKAMMMNIGFAEASKNYSFDCVIFHDIDTLPEDGRNFYTCFNNPRHVAVYHERFDYILPYEDLFGGATAFTSEQFLKVNGFSNTYYGWGGEDDDMYKRVVAAKYSIVRFPKSIARYNAITHGKDLFNPKNRFGKRGLEERNGEYQSEGLNSLKYDLKKIEVLPLCTWIKVAIDPPTIFYSDQLKPNRIVPYDDKDYRRKLEQLMEGRKANE